MVQTDSNSPRALTVATAIEGIRKAPLICFFLVLAIVGFFYHEAVGNKVFPTASIDLKYTRSQILEKARGLSAKFGYERKDTIDAVNFDSDENAKTFLERQFGQTEANRLMQGAIPVWFWDCRFMQQFQQEKSSLRLSPTGELYNFRHEMPNDKKLPSLDRSAAEQVARTFVETEAHLPLAQWKLIDSKDVTQVGNNRIDHSFIWEESAADYKGAHRRAAVRVSGNIIGFFDLSLHTPESWDRSYETMRSYNEALGKISFVPFILLALATFFIFARAVATKSYSLKAAVITGVIFGGVALASSLNSYPSWAIEYKTTDSYQSFLLRQFSTYVLSACAAGVLIGILCGAAQPLYRKLCPNRLPIEKWFSLDALRSPQMIEGIILGYACCGLSQGYQVCYYFLGQRVGYWCPMALDQYQIFGSLFPFVDALAIGVMAAVMEEGLYRIVALALFQKLCFGNFWVANFLQAAAWGFMHSTYPQQPAYARGVELTLEGMFSGWLLRRYGLIPCLVGHYVFDAFCGVEPLKAAPPGIALSGLIPLLIPAAILVACLAVSKKRGFIDDVEVARQAEETHQVQTAERDRHAATLPIAAKLPAFSYKESLSNGKRVAACAVAAIAMLVMTLCNIPTIGRQAKSLTTSRSEAIEIGKNYWRGNGNNVNVDGYLVSTAVESGIGERPYVVYLNEKLGFAKTKELVEGIEHPYQWSVEFRKPLQAEEYSIYIDESGKVLSPFLKYMEDTAGANLPEPQARAIAEAFVSKYRPELTPMEFRDSEKKLRKNRTDYWFQYAVPKLKAADADMLVQVGIVGDKVAYASPNWRVPDQWMQSYQKQTTLGSVLAVLQPILSVVGILLALWFIVELMRHSHIRWKWPCIIGGALVGLKILDSAANLPSFFRDYSTTTPLDIFLVQNCCTLVATYVFQGFLVLLFASVASGVLVKYFHDIDFSSALNLAFKMQPKSERASQNALWLDGVLATAAFFALLALGDAGFALLRSQFGHEPAVASLPGAMAYANSLCLPYSVFSAGMSSMAFTLCGLICVPALLHRFLKGHWIWCSIVIAASVLAFDNESKYVSDYLLAAGPALLGAALLWFVVLRDAKRNFLAVPLLGWGAMVPTIATIYKHGMPMLAADFCIVMCILFAPLAYLLYMQVGPAPVVTPAPALVPVPMPLAIDVTTSDSSEPNIP